VQAFITIGQGITKFRLMYRMDWDQKAYRAAWCSRVLVTTGMFFAGLPAIGILTRHWTNAPIVKAVVSLPASALLPGAGFVVIVLGVHAAMRAVCGGIEQDLVLPYAGFWWSDYYASADPVSNGPLANGSGQKPGPSQTVRDQTGLPGPCNQVYNSASIFFDHNRYLRNQDQLLSQLINDLAAAAYGNSPAGPKIVCDDDLKKVGKRRHRLALWLIAARISVVGLAVELWQVNLSPLLKRPMNRLVELLAPHTAMGNGFARFLAATLISAGVYIALLIVWRIRERYVVRRFFRTAEHAMGTSQQGPLGQSIQAVEKQMSISAS
jgi:hypothetical protein